MNKKITFLVFLFALSFKLSAVNYYTYQSGDWGAVFIWTTDPSGTTLVGSATPGVGDNIFILNGRNISTAIARTVTATSIQGGGSLDLGSSTGHNLGAVTGDGLMRLQTSTFPGGTFTNFVNSTGGTIEYYDFGGAGTNLPSQTTYNNLIFSNSTATNHTMVLPSAAPITYTVNGNVSILTTGSGSMALKLASAAKVINLNISGGLNVGSNCSLTCSNFNAIHNIQVGLDFVNNGLVDLSNSAQYTAANNGAANVIFTGLQHSNFICNGQTDVYSAQVNKGTDQTFRLTILSNNVNNFKFFTNGTGLVITNGTLRLTENLSFTRLNNGDNYDVSTSQNENGCLWIDGADVILNGGCNAIVVYGKFRMSAGNFTIGNEGLVIRIAGEILIEGGISNIEKYRSSTISGYHIGSFTMTGGVLNVTSTLVGSSSSDSPRFSHPFPGQSFTMTGGTINIEDPETGTAGAGGILIGNDPANILVTGGTWNVVIPATSTNFNICSTAPFYNLNITKAGAAGTGMVTLSNQTIGPNVIEVYRPSPVLAQPLVVINDLNILTGNSPALSAGSSDVIVARNFNLQTGTSYLPGSNTTKFNGPATQIFTINGTINTAFNNFTVDKPLQKALNIAGTQNILTINGALTIQTGTLSDGGKILNVNGNIINSGFHNGSGSIRLTGTGAQTIGGDGTGKFNTLILNKTSGSTTLTANQTINGNLRLANTAAILDLSVYNLSLGTPNNIYDDIAGTGTTFSNTKMLRTSGNASDAGLTKKFSSSVSSFTYPLGTGNDYTPSTIAFTGTLSAYGNGVTVRPANLEQANVTALNRSLTYHWRVTTSGVTLGAATATQTFTYVASKVVLGPGIVESEYKTAKYKPSTNSWVKGSTAHVNTTTKVLTFSSATFGNVLDGDYTAGDDTPTDPFGAVVVYYTIKSGNWDDVNPATTPWSTISNFGAPAGTIPGPNSPVQIGNGAGAIHTIMVTNNSKTCGSIVIGNNSILDLGVSTGHNFGIYTTGSIPNAGVLKISSALPTAEFPAGDFGNFTSTAGGTMEYYSTGAVDFTIPSISAAPSNSALIAYRNLTIKAGAGREITMPNTDLLVRSSLNLTGAASNSVVKLNSASEKSLTITQNLLVNSGMLKYMNGFAQSVVVNGNLTINNNARFEVENTGSAVTNELNVKGNLTINGVLKLNAGSNRICNTTFIGNVNKSITGTNVLAEATFNKVTVDKGSNQTAVLTLDFAGILTTPTNNWLFLENGTFQVSKATSLTLSDAALTSYTIPGSAALQINHVSAIINIVQFADNANDLFLAGKLEINAGTVNIGNASNNNNNDIEYVAASSPEINISGGTLYVNGQIRRSTTVTTGFLSYTQTGNSAVIIGGRNQNAIRAKLEIVNPNSVFNMSGNSTLTIMRGGGTTYSDVYLDPNTSLVSGGTIIFASTGTGAQTYNLDTTVPLFNVTVDGNSGEVATVRLPVNTLLLKGSLLINNVNSIFNTNGRDVTILKDFTNLNTSNSAGVNTGGYRPFTTTQTTFFKSILGNQSIGGVSGNLTNFANLVIENDFITGVVEVLPNSNLRINTILTINDGTFNTGSNTVTAINNIYNQSTHTSSGAGTIVLGGSVLQFIDGDNNGIFGSVRVNNATGVQTRADIKIEGTLNLNTGLLYIDNNLLTFGSSALATGTFSATRMIRTNGVISDSGVVKIFPVGASSFTIPFGVTGKYTPVTYTVNANSAIGTIQVRPINSKHPATTDAAAKELNFYWLTKGSGFSGLNLTHVYNYINADVNGTEASYVTGRFLANAWTPLFGIGSTVNAAANTITLSNVAYTDGGFTAGENTEFNVITDLYSRDATLGGNWSDVNSWSAIGHSGPPAGVTPSFQNIFIAAGHTITGDNNFLTCSNLSLNGTLDLVNFIGNNFGIVSGTGRLRITSTASNNYVFPAGNYSSFIASSGGTVEYYGTTNANLLTQQYYNNLEFTGSGVKSLTNVDLGVNGSFRILGGAVNNAFNRNIDVKMNWVNNVNSSAFIAGTGIVRMLGANQTIGGTATTNFYNLTIGGTLVKSLGINQVINNNLLISLGSTLDVTASNFAIDLKGNFTGNGILLARAGLITLNGSIAQQQIGGSGSCTFHHLTLQNSLGAKLNTDANLRGTLTCNQGNFVNSGAAFTLLSTSTATARIAPLIAGTYTGAITMQRFAPGGVTGWAFLSAPVSGAKINQWTDDFPTSGFVGSTGWAAGFISIYYYDETAPGNFDSPQSYVAVTNANTNSINPGVGCWVFLGDSLNNTSDLTIDVTGTIVKGNFDFNVTNSPAAGALQDGWNFIANPYPSTIDWDAATGWTKLNVNNAVYIYQADLDQYATYIAGVGVNGGSRYIASSQGFYVKTVSTPTLTSTEEVKSATNPTFLKSGKSQTENEVLHVTLKGNSSYSDEMAIRLSQEATLAFDEQLDGLKLGSVNSTVPYIASAMPQQDLSINSISSIDKNYDIPVRVKVGLSGDYTFTFSGANTMHGISCLLFEDTYTGIITDLTSDTSYTCSLSDTASAPRFFIRTRAALQTQEIATSCANKNDGAIVFKNENLRAQNIRIRNQHGALVAEQLGSGATLEINNLAAGVYVVSYANTALTCKEITDTITIASGIAVTANFNLTSDTIYLSESNQLVLLNTSANATQYTWNFAGENNTNEAATFNVVETGEFTVSLTASNGGCESNKTATITVLNTRASDAQPFITNTNNGALIHFNFKSNTTVQMSAYNALGQLVVQPINIDVSQQNYFVDLSDKASGVYFVHVIYNNQKVIQKIQH